MSNLDAFIEPLKEILPSGFTVQADYITDNLIVRDQWREFIVSRWELESRPLGMIATHIKVTGGQPDPGPLAEWPLAERLTYYASKFKWMPDGPGAVLWGYICADMDEAAKLLQTPKAT